MARREVRIIRNPSAPKKRPYEEIDPTPATPAAEDRVPKGQQRTPFPPPSELHQYDVHADGSVWHTDRSGPAHIRNRIDARGVVPPEVRRYLGWDREGDA